MSDKMIFSTWGAILSKLSYAARQAYVWWIALALLFLPLVLLSCYNHPAADDYFYVVDVMKKGFAGAQVNSYMTWSGRYISTIWLTGNPILWGSLAGYRMVNVFLLLGTAISCLFLVSTLLNKKKLNGVTIAVSVCFLFLYLSGMPSLTEGFYWLAGAMTYQLPNISTFMVIALLFKMKREYSLGKLITILVLCITICGGNETSMLELLYLLVAMMLYEYFTAHKIPNYYYTVLFVSAIATGIVLLAPGNAIRASFFHGEKNLIKALWLSSSSSFWVLINWLPNILITLILFIPFLKEVEVNSADQRKITPGILIVYPLLIVGILIVGFFPAYWSVGSAPPARTLNVLYWLFIGSCLHYAILCIVYIKQEHQVVKSIPGYIQAVFLFILLVNIAPVNNLRTASMDLISRRAMIYNREMNDRYTYMKNNQGKAVSVESITVKPKSVFFTDIEIENTKDWKNVCVADYFKLKSLYRYKSIE